MRYSFHKISCRKTRPPPNNKKALAEAHKKIRPPRLENSGRRVQVIESPGARSRKLNVRPLCPPSVPLKIHSSRTAKFPGRAVARSLSDSRRANRPPPPLPPRHPEETAAEMDARATGREKVSQIALRHGGSFRTTLRAGAARARNFEINLHRLYGPRAA